MKSHAVHETLTITSKHHHSSRFPVIIKCGPEHMDLQGLIYRLFTFRLGTALI